MALAQQMLVYDEPVADDQEFIDMGEKLIRKLEALDLPYEDGIPMESNWHRLQMSLLIELIEQHWKDRSDYFVGGNMFIYFSTSQAKNRDYRGPDFFLVKDTHDDRNRKSWILWDEDGKYPNVIVELASQSTIKMDLGFKRKLYERTFRTPEYFCYDPATATLYGWRLNNGDYQPITIDENGRMESREMGLWIGPWEGEHSRLHTRWLRLFTADGQLVHKFAEAEAQRAEAEAQRAEAEAQRAEAEAQRAKVEAQRADSAEAELNRLKALLVEKGIES